MWRCLILILIGIPSVFAVADESGCAVADESGWLVREHFEAFSLLADYRVDAEEIQLQLTGLASELSETLGVTTTGEPIQVLLFDSRKRYLDYVGSAVPTTRERRAVFVRKGSLASIYCYRSDATLNDLRHEMTHAILHQHLQFLPLWMDEGLAEYFEETPEQRFRSSRTKSIRWKSAVGWSPDLERLERIAVAGDMKSTDYRDSWAVCCYLLNDSRESRSMLRDYLQQIHDGHAPPQFSVSLKAKRHEWQGRFQAYFRKPTFAVSGQFSDLR